MTAQPSDSAPRGLRVGRGERTRVLIARVAARRDVRQSDLVHSASRAAPVAWARHELRWCLRMLEPGYSNSQIGRLTGDADPTTVRHSVARVRERMRSDPDYAAEMQDILDEFLAPADARDAAPAALPLAPILNALRLILGSVRLSDREARTIALATLDAQEAGDA